MISDVPLKTFLFQERDNQLNTFRLSERERPIRALPVAESSSQLHPKSPL